MMASMSKPVTIMSSAALVRIEWPEISAAIPWSRPARVCDWVSL
jgi:hypothetical protein